MDILELVKRGQEAELRQKMEDEKWAKELEAMKVKKLSHFDFMTSLYVKDYVINESNVSQYQPFMVNRGMSNGINTIAHAYIMDQLSDLPKEMQYDYYFHAIAKGKQYNKWAKEDKVEHVDAVMEIYEVSKQKAIDIIRRLTTEELTQLVDWYDDRRGGQVR